MNDKLNRKLLVQRYVENKCSPDELEIFFFLLKQGELDEYLNDDMKEVLLDEEDADSGIRHKNPVIWPRYVIAAAILFAIALVTWLKLNTPPKTLAPVADKTPADFQAPGENRAILKLSNGKTVFLDSAGNGVLASQGNVKIEKTVDGRIIYQGSSTELFYNTLSNPRGSKVINLKLSDGSMVWLNAGSSVEYPVSFIGGRRELTISGEAYFEVSKNTLQPFVVKANGTFVEVLGTHFNINAYTDEPAVRTTLIEGSVKVSRANQAIILKPGQQANVASEENIRLVANADLEEVMAWKNGLFQFRKAEIATIMRQLSRWYDVEIVYEGEIPKDRFSGNLPRDSKLSVILSALEQSQVHFRVEGKKIIVVP